MNISCSSYVNRRLCNLTGAGYLFTLFCLVCDSGTRISSKLATHNLYFCN